MTNQQRRCCEGSEQPEKNPRSQSIPQNKEWMGWREGHMEGRMESAQERAHAVRPNRVRPNRVGPNRVVPNRVGPNRVVPNRVGPNHVRANRVGTATKGERRSPQRDELRPRDLYLIES
jgi:hypothetical protein